MKKFIVGILAAMMVVGLAGCAAKTTTDKATTPATEAQTDAKTEGETSTKTEDETPAADSDAQGADTLGTKLGALFESEIAASTDIEAIANKLAETADLDCVVVPAVEGYLNGFSDEVKGFGNAFQFSPMIGSIPFVGYIFETEDADALEETLKSLADPRWNICTEAAETVCVKHDGYVFFTMCPSEEELLGE